jgi:protein-L-isoaspartate(D-aspartate) O-methyltransferase
MSVEMAGIGMTSARTRQRLIGRLKSQGITNEEVLLAIETIPRHLFMDEAIASRAYEDTALPIGHGQTISQPYVVALMTSILLAGEKPKRVLEIGTGCGYQTAVLANLVEEVYTVELIEPLYRGARQRLRKLGYHNIHFKLADSKIGWPEQGLFDAIIATAAAEQVPADLLAQLNVGARLVIPIGKSGAQDLLQYTRTENDFECKHLADVSFVPLINTSTSTGD